MAVFQRKDGRWCVYYPDPENYKKRKWEYFGRGAEAGKKAHERNAELNLEKRGPGKAMAQASPTFRELVAEYMKAKRKDNEYWTRKNFFIKMQGVILPEIGDTPAVQVDSRRLDQYATKRLESPRMVVRTYGPGREIVEKRPMRDADGNPLFIKRTTVAREISDILAVLNWSVKNKFLTYNPAAGFEKPKLDNARMRPPSVDEAARIFANAAPHLVRALAISFYTGTRPGSVELLSLKWDDVDFDGNSIFIRSARKNGPPERTVPLHGDFKKMLAMWHRADEKDGSPAHIVHYNGKPVKSVKKAYGTAKRKAGITRRLRMYDFRHAFATFALKAGGDLKAVSRLLGHSRVDTTANIYQHIDDEMKRDAVDRLPSMDLTTIVVKKKKKAGKNSGLSG